MLTTTHIPTPDFETYSMDDPITSASLNDDVVSTTFKSGKTARYHLFWLRDNCGCGKCIDSNSHERVNSIGAIPDDLGVETVGVSDSGGLLIKWTDRIGECDEGHYHPGWLQRFDYSNSVQAVDAWPIKTWGQGLEGDLPLFSADAVFNDEETRYDFLVAIRTLGLALVTDMPKDYEAFERISSQIGLLRDMNWGKIFEIEPKPDGEYIANRGFALDAHADASTREYQPGFQIFQCVENTSEGGESFWVDGFYIANMMKEQYPEEHRLLSTVKWEQANRAKGTHYRWNAPIFDYDADGRLTIRDTTWLREPLLADFDLVPKVMNAYRTYVRLKAKRENQVERKLVEGDVAFVDNRRALHGRRAFTPGTGRRHIRTCYGEREELLSSIRMIERARDARKYQ